VVKEKMQQKSTINLLEKCIYIYLIEFEANTLSVGELIFVAKIFKYYYVLTDALRNECLAKVMVNRKRMVKVSGYRA
jgi:hypothetical protein